MYFAEKAIIKALPKMAKAARSSELKQAFETHFTQTEEHVRRLELVFELIGRQAEGTPCEAIKGIIKEGDEVADEFGETARPTPASSHPPKPVEHYEIARYGTLKAWAEELGLDEVVSVFEATEEEESETDQILTDLSVTLNSSAAGVQPRS